MKLILQIKKADVYDEIGKITAYVGAKNIDNTGISYSNISTTDDDRELLERFWRDAVDNVAIMCDKYVSSFSSPTLAQAVNPAEVFALTLEMPANYNALLQDVLEIKIRSYCINMIMSKWLSITNRTDVEYYTNLCVADRYDIINLLYSRLIPSR